MIASDLVRYTLNAASPPVFVASWLVAMMGLVVLLGAPLIWLWQSVVWLRYGFWPDLSIADVWQLSGMPFLDLTWVGIIKIENWIFQQAFSMTLLMLGIILIFTGFSLAKNAS